MAMAPMGEPYASAKNAMNAAMGRAFDGSTYAGLADAALAALTTDPGVRAALVAKLNSTDGWWDRDAARTADEEGQPMPGIRTWVLADVILAALRPPGPIR
jgi:hypothetical protein